MRVAAPHMIRPLHDTGRAGRHTSPGSTLISLSSRQWSWRAAILVIAVSAARCLAVDPVAVLEPPDADEELGGDFGRSVAEVHANLKAK
jgi:hypothetical protein